MPYRWQFQLSSFRASVMAATTAGAGRRSGLPTLRSKTSRPAATASSRILNSVAKT
ncbi:MAG: hypothetical protein IPP62_04045 [bacterium]|nr:hypothetical protein [bacterium]